jgi:hypothetical protein
MPQLLKCVNVSCKHMTTFNDFSEYYKTISNTELLNILDSPDDYQPSAVVAANTELSKRRLSESELQKARQPLINKQEEKHKERENAKATKAKIIGKGHTLMDILNPIQAGIPSIEKTIRYIVIIFGGIFLYRFITDYRTHLAYLRDIPGFPLESISYLLPQILLPLATIAFWKRKTMGWTLLTIFLTFSAIGAVWLLFESFSWKPYDPGGLKALFKRPSPTVYVIQSLFSVGTMYVLCKENMRAVFSISQQKMATTIGITVLATLILILITS